VPHTDEEWQTAGRGKSRPAPAGKIWIGNKLYPDDAISRNPDALKRVNELTRQKFTLGNQLAATQAKLNDTEARLRNKNRMLRGQLNDLDTIRGSVVPIALQARGEGYMAAQAQIYGDYSHQLGTQQTPFDEGYDPPEPAGQQTPFHTEAPSPTLSNQAVDNATPPSTQPSAALPPLENLPLRESRFRRSSVGAHSQPSRSKTRRSPSRRAKSPRALSQDRTKPSI